MAQYTVNDVTICNNDNDNWNCI